MAAQVTNYQCPSCTGPLHFVGASGKLECDYCGATYDVAEIEALYAEKEEKAAAAQQSAEEKMAAERQAAGEGGWEMPDLSADWGAEGDGMKAYSCPSCGAELICDASTAATSCPYCGNPTVVPGQSHKRTEGEYEVIKTEHFDVYRAGTMPFEKVPVDASTKMPDDHMDSIEPYNYDDLKPFSTAYLPGFLADKFDVSADKSRERADVRCLGSLKKALQGTVTGYATCFPRGEHADIQRGKVHYALLPVWLLNTKWQGKDFLFAMNGQTGKFVGDLPVDKGRFWGMFAAIAVPLSVLSSVIVLLMR